MADAAGRRFASRSAASDPDDDMDRRCGRRHGPVRPRRSGRCRYRIRRSVPSNATAYERRLAKYGRICHRGDPGMGIPEAVAPGTVPGLGLQESDHRVLPVAPLDDVKAFGDCLRH